MIFFTIEWANGHLNDSLWDSISKLYDKNLEHLLSNASPEILDLSELDVNDFRIKSIVELDNELKLSISFDEINVKISYSNGFLINSNISKKIINRELRYDELYFDEVCEKYTHNFLCSDNFEFGISFSDVNYIVSD